MASLGKSIRLARLEAELTTNDPGNSIVLNPSTLASWEHDLEAPRREYLFRLSLQFPELNDTFKDRDGLG